MLQIRRRHTLSLLLNEPFTFLGGLLFFLMLFSPAYNVAFKIILIAILLVSVITSRIFFNKLNVTSEVLLWYILFVFHGIFFSLIGFIHANNETYILHAATYNIIWPVLYLIFTIGIYKKSSLHFLARIIVIANVLVSLYLIFSTLTLFGLIPKIPFVSFEMARIDFDPTAGLLKTQTPSVVTLLFSTPFVIALALTDTENKSGFKKWFLHVAITVSIIAILTTARRALILNIFLGLLLTCFFAFSAKAINRKKFKGNLFRMLFIGIAFLTALLITVQKLGLIDVSLVYEKFISAFASKENVADVSTSIRYDQFDLLIKSWLQNPLLGKGHGAVSQYIVRSNQFPWEYELSYVALLFQTGIIGVLIYLGLLFWPIYKGWRLLKRVNNEAAILIISAIVGSSCFLIANATNPYLISYDYMWALFFPIAVVNYYTKQNA